MQFHSVTEWIAETSDVRSLSSINFNRPHRENSQRADGVRWLWRQAADGSAAWWVHRHVYFKSVFPEHPAATLVWGERVVVVVVGLGGGAQSPSWFLILSLGVQQRAMKLLSSTMMMVMNNLAGISDCRLSLCIFLSNLKHITKRFNTTNVSLLPPFGIDSRTHSSTWGSRWEGIAIYCGIDRGLFIPKSTLNLSIKMFACISASLSAWQCCMRS